jgi:nitroimidazol reductase NimA-like FMN-containing flavoprotein (pyridoxamine 5'-phosphate oxidase superfamily)
MSSYYNKDDLTEGNVVDVQRSMIRLSPPSPRVTVRRRAGRAAYDVDTVNAILDEGVVGHLGIISAGQPYVLPVVYARCGDEVVLHGSPLSRLLSGLAGGAPVCLTVTLLDGLVFARSAFHHSVNYRSVVVVGEARPVVEFERKREALRAIVEHIAPGRSGDVRGPSDGELAATEVVVLALDEASAKIRTGPPVDAAEDYALGCWAGEVPLRLAPAAPFTDARCLAPVPAYARSYERTAAHFPPTLEEPHDEPPVAA